MQAPLPTKEPRRGEACRAIEAGYRKWFDRELTENPLRPPSDPVGFAAASLENEVGRTIEAA